MIALDQMSCVADISRYQAKINANRVAQIFEGRETTYAELDKMASQIANGLIKEGCQPAAASLSNNTPHDHILLLS